MRHCFSSDAILSYHLYFLRALAHNDALIVFRSMLLKYAMSDTRLIVSEDIVLLGRCASYRKKLTFEYKFYAI